MRLQIEEIDNWPSLLSKLPFVPGEHCWRKSIAKIGRLNNNPTLPVEGILLTFRPEGKYEARLFRLLDQIETDSICRHLTVLGFDEDQYDSPCA